MTQTLAPWCFLKMLHGAHGTNPRCPGLKAECSDCGSTTRALEQVSSKVWLCATCKRERKKARRTKGRETRQQKVFGLTLAEEADILEFQGGGCICKPWTGYNGASRTLSTDHDHTTGEIRGKLCKHCNDLLGRVKDDPEYFRRMINYLANPPAKRILGSRVVPGHVA